MPQVQWYVSLIQAFVIINLVLVTFAYLTLAERKIMARMQLRYGPNRAGPYGLLQPIDLTDRSLQLSRAVAAQLYRLQFKPQCG